MSRIVIDNLGQLAGADEGQGADTLAYQLGEEVRRLAVGAAAHALSRIYERRIPEDKLLAAVGGAVVIDHAKGQARQLFGVLTGVGDGRRAADKQGVRTVETAEPPQAAEHTSHVGAEDAAIDMGFVHHHVLQAPQQPRPLLVVGQYAHMEHIGVGQYQPCPPSYVPPLRLWRIAVEGGKIPRG